MPTPRPHPQDRAPDASLGPVRAYYRELAPWLDRSLGDRGDGPFWEWVVRQGAPTAGRPSVLELGAGSGRATEHLAVGAARVVGLDVSMDMLRRARRRLAGTPHVLLLAADARRFSLDARFDLVVAANDPLSHLTSDGDRDLALARVTEHLAPGGRFLLDGLWLPPERERVAASGDGLVRERDVSGPDGSPPLGVREEWRCDPETRACTARFRFASGGRVVARATFDGRYWSEAEVRERMARAGLEPVRWWGDFRRTPWDADLSEHLIVQARRG